MHALRNTDISQDHSGPEPGTPSDVFAHLAAQSQALVEEFLRRHPASSQFGGADPLNVGKAFFDMTARMLADPAKLIEAQVSLWETYLQLWQQASSRLFEGSTEAAAPAAHHPALDDRRFHDSAWNENPVYDFIKQSYLLTSRWLLATVRDVDGLDEKTAQKIDFYTRQFIDALAPTNFVLTNPVVLKETLDSKGENLMRGLNNLLADLDRGGGSLAISMTDQSAFTLGKNVATTPGKVIYQNDLIQLLQYTPTTETVFSRPLLIIPPWINKYYVLDLQPKNSFIRYAVSRGYTVFVVSWVNPDERLAHKSFEDYMKEGVLAALDAIGQATGQKAVNAIGYCLGGTLLSATLAYMVAKKDQRIVSATFLATLVDFTNPGELGVFIDEEQLALLEQRMRQRGFLEGREMATTFNMLRANDLIWSFVVNNYLMGKDPLPFDLLYWNADSTRMPAEMHSFYLRAMYQENKLVRPGGITLDGVPIDLRRITVPTYLLAAKEDHIAPWSSTFAATGLYGGPLRFVLSGSGHIAGIINPPEPAKYGYSTGPVGKGMSAANWLESAVAHPGSWWTDWDAWQSKLAGKRVKARAPGDGALKPIEDAPGSYVVVRV